MVGLVNTLTPLAVVTPDITGDVQTTIAHL